MNMIYDSNGNKVKTITSRLQKKTNPALSIRGEGDSVENIDVKSFLSKGFHRKR